MNYYNDNDPFSVKWLKELMTDGLIPQGDIDDRSITDIKPSDLDGYTQCHFFAGIGGWPYALRLAGWEDDRPCWTGSCPCQPFSVAGKGKGLSDPRHLWPAFRWLIAQCRPSTVFGEQVASKDGRLWLAGVRSDLEALGYRVGAADLCASGIGAPHIRQRLWWMAYSKDSDRRCGISREETRVGQGGLRRRGFTGSSSDGRLENPSCLGRGRRSDGDSGRDSGALQTEGHGASCGLADASDERTVRAGQTKQGCDRKDNGIPRQDGRETVSRLADGFIERLEGHAGNERDRSEPGRVDTEETGPATQGSCVNWFDAIWWPCRDGKYRRVPARWLEDAGKWEAQPFFQSVVDGLSSNLGDVWTSSLQKINGRIEKYAEAEKIRPDQVLREMRDFIETEEIRGKSGGLNQIYEEEVLLVALCQLKREMGRVPQGVSEGIDQVQEGLLREMREEAGRPEATPCSSQEHELERKCSEQLRNLVHELSHEVSQCEEAIGVIEAASSCFPLAGNIPNRVGILRGAGNAIVPELAALFIKSFKEIPNP